MRNLKPRDLVGQVLKSQLSTLNCCKLLLFFKLMIYFWLCWVCVAVHRLSPVWWVGCSSLQCLGFSRCGAQALRQAGLVTVLSCSMACGIFLDLGLNPCLLHWEEDSWTTREVYSLLLKTACSNLQTREQTHKGDIQDLLWSDFCSLGLRYVLPVLCRKLWHFRSPYSLPTHSCL